MDREVEINERLGELETEIESLRKEQKSLVRERDEIVTKASALQKIANMSAAERKALGIPEPQVVGNAGGVESGESVGTPGS